MDGLLILIMEVVACCGFMVLLSRSTKTPRIALEPTLTAPKLGYVSYNQTEAECGTIEPFFHKGKLYWRYPGTTELPPAPQDDIAYPKALSRVKAKHWLNCYCGYNDSYKNNRSYNEFDIHYWLNQSYLRQLENQNK